MALSDFMLDFSSLDTEVECKKKKAPGRPRKIPQKAPSPKLGIITEPNIPDALFELYYSNPEAFENALGFYLSLSDMPLHCKFSSNSIIHLALDRHKKSKIAIVCDPLKFNYYYCKPDSLIQFGVSNQYLDLLVKSIDSDVSTIKWYSLVDKNDETYVDLYMPEYKVTDQESLICCGKYQQIDDQGFDDDDYQIKFQISARRFKRLLSKAKAYGDQINLRQVGCEYPLTINYSNSNGHVKSSQLYEGKQEMNFSSNIKSGEIFDISVLVKYWYPVANAAMLNSTIQISLHKEKPILTKIILDDGAICIKVLTSINDIRQDSDITSTITSTSVRNRDSTNATPKSIHIPELKMDFELPSQPQSPKILTPLNERRARGNSDLPE